MSVNGVRGHKGIRTGKCEREKKEGCLDSSERGGKN